ncbi:unnamed protein product [Timema podura]|uniref:Tubby C-terminal domain-containing protein n=1 Tax=Timema podura TaxID=61482 RepID=A0ABN7NQC6_TIMPD|nr:unnamed protein product [Timema podura]
MESFSRNIREHVAQQNSSRRLHQVLLEPTDELVNSCGGNVLSLTWLEDGRGEGWLTVAGEGGLAGVVKTTTHTDTPRSNFNLRTKYHKGDILYASWNEEHSNIEFQALAASASTGVSKLLATCDESGVLCLWCPKEGLWVIQSEYTLDPHGRRGPCIITDLAWSRDGLFLVTLLYESVLAVINTDPQSNEVFPPVRTLTHQNVTCLTLSPDNMHANIGTKTASILNVGLEEPHHEILTWIATRRSAVPVTKLSWNCSRFYRRNEAEPWKFSHHLLATSLNNGLIYLTRGCLHDRVGVVSTDLLDVNMEWNEQGIFLAAVGRDKRKSALALRIYSALGRKLYDITVLPALKRCSDSLLRAQLVWGHSGTRLFMALGQELRVAQLIMAQGVPSLERLSFLEVCKHVHTSASVCSLNLPHVLNNQLVAQTHRTITCSAPKGPNGSFLLCPIQQNTFVHCTLSRNNYMSYTLCTEHLGKLIPILKAERIPGFKIQFIIYDPRTHETGSIFDNENSSRYITPKENVGVQTIQTQRTMAKLTSNLWGTKFVLNASDASLPQILGEIIYKPNFLHFRPWKIKFIIGQINPKDITKIASTEVTTSGMYCDPADLETTSKILFINLATGPPTWKYQQHTPAVDFCCENLQSNCWLRCNIRRRNLIFSTFINDKYNQKDKAIPTMQSIFGTSVAKTSGIEKMLVVEALSICQYNSYLSRLNRVLNMSAELTEDPEKCKPIWSLPHSLELRRQELPFYDDNIITLYRTHSVAEQYSSKHLNKAARKHSTQKPKLLQRFRKLKCIKQIFSDPLEEVTRLPVTEKITLTNKLPEWSDLHSVYQLNFRSRVMISSEKNCQFEYDKALALQFGRVSENVFTLDFSYPFSPIQAFALGLSCLTRNMK